MARSTGSPDGGGKSLTWLDRLKAGNKMTLAEPRVAPKAKKPSVAKVAPKPKSVKPKLVKPKPVRRK